jgi:23S rRNA pseudouridine1911/1915/1917 synthase
MIAHFFDEAFLYVWKPHGVPSTFGKVSSFLEEIANADFFVDQKSYFTMEQEYGLLNRLDNDTAWLLYFARRQDIYDLYIQAQDRGDVSKHYIAALSGDVTSIPLMIAYPIGHHRHHSDRMIVRLSADDDLLMRGQWHPAETCLESLGYDPKSNTTWLHIMISKGVRHQIRSHLASVWLPILGEKLYKRKKDKNVLHLWSVGLSVDL